MNPFTHIQEESTPAVSHKIMTPALLDNIQQALNKGATLQIVPQGAKGIIIKKELSIELQQSVSDVILKLQEIKGITSQESSTAANLILKQAKGLVKDLENERKKMDQILNDEKNDNKAIEASIVGQLAALVQVVNNNITAFQVDQERIAKERQAAIQKQKDEELAAAQKERERITRIKSLILKFESSVIGEANKATMATIDTLLAQLKGAKISTDVYMEFHDDALKMHQESIAFMEARKIELVKFDQLEKENKAQAAELIAHAQAKAERDRIELEAKQQQIDDAAKDQEMNDLANIQLTHELKSTMNVGAKGVQKRWTFDEETIDMSLLPDEFKTFDKAAITQAIASGRYQIDGVHIFQKIINTSR